MDEALADEARRRGMSKAALIRLLLHQGFASSDGDNSALAAHGLLARSSRDLIASPARVTPLPCSG